MKIPSILAGVAGEYFVAAELSRRGHIASISLRNTRGIDILATNREASRSVTIQCKTKQSTRRATIWILNENCETYFSDTHFYVLIALGAVGERPRYHIVPSCDVAKYVSKSHREWLRKRGVEGGGMWIIRFAIFQILKIGILRNGICSDYNWLSWRFVLAVILAAFSIGQYASMMELK